LLVPKTTDVSGSIKTDTTWTLAGSPYIVVGDVTVEPGVELVILNNRECIQMMKGPTTKLLNDYLKKFLTHICHSSTLILLIHWLITCQLVPRYGNKLVVR
jgi:hypothetical protein